jgi:hypothetical protein
MSLEPHAGRAVAIIAGGTTRPGRDIASGLATWGWPIVVVYLDDQARAEATIAEIITAGGTAVAVRAALWDDLDVGRLFTESTAAFGVVDVLIDTTTENSEPLYQGAAQYVRAGGMIVIPPGTVAMSGGLESRLRRRSIAVGRVPAEAVLTFLERWWQQDHR